MIDLTKKLIVNHIWP